MHCCQLSVVTYLSIIGKLLRGLEVPVLFVGSGRGGRVLQRSAVVAMWSLHQHPPRTTLIVSNIALIYNIFNFSIFTLL